jgi:hypothetical protein
VALQSFCNYWGSCRACAFYLHSAVCLPFDTWPSCGIAGNNLSTYSTYIGFITRFGSFFYWNATQTLCRGGTDHDNWIGFNCRHVPSNDWQREGLLENCEEAEAAEATEAYNTPATASINDAQSWIHDTRKHWIHWKFRLRRATESMLRRPRRPREYDISDDLVEKRSDNLSSDYKLDHPTGLPLSPMSLDGIDDVSDNSHAPIIIPGVHKVHQRHWSPASYTYIYFVHFAWVQ